MGVVSPVPFGAWRLATRLTPHSHPIRSPFLSLFPWLHGAPWGWEERCGHHSGAMGAPSSRPTRAPCATPDNIESWNLEPEIILLLLGGWEAWVKGSSVGRASLGATCPRLLPTQPFPPHETLRSGEGGDGVSGAGAERFLHSPVPTSPPLQRELE